MGAHVASAPSRRNDMHAPPSSQGARRQPDSPIPLSSQSPRFRGDLPAAGGRGFPERFPDRGGDYRSTGNVVGSRKAPGALRRNESGPGPAPANGARRQGGRRTIPPGQRPQGEFRPGQSTGWTVALRRRCWWTQGRRCFAPDRGHRRCACAPERDAPGSGATTQRGWRNGKAHACIRPGAMNRAASDVGWPMPGPGAGWKGLAAAG